jgi:uncharacterized membrane protein
MSDSPYTTPPTPPAPPTPQAAGPGSNAKVVVLLGWIFAPLGIIVIFLDDFKNDMFVRTHTIQAAAFWVAVWVVNAVLGMTGILALLVPIVGLLAFIYQIFMGIQGYNGKTVEVPLVYGVVKSFIEKTS